ncbi:cytochrome P450 [Gongronella butleri]|nr:cytochrome P450 [Gongronella butleri]
MHDKYGPVMRLGPKSISVADKDMIKQVLSQDDLQKGEVYDSFKKNDTHTLFSTRDKAFHKNQRRLISPAFSIKYLNSLEELMHEVMSTMLKRVSSQVDANGGKATSVDVWHMWQTLALDTIGTTAFGQSFNMIENDSHPVPDCIAREMRLASWAANHPFLVKLLTFGRTIKTNPIILDFMGKVIKERIESGKRRNDILQILLDTKESSNPNDRLSDIAIITETVLFLIAGSETTSNTLGFAIIELLRHPSALKRLQEEVDTLELPENGVFRHEQVKTLPYLNAVINETLRLDAMAANSIERIADHDVMLGGKLFIPKGTSVAANVYHAHLNDKYWPNASSFEPERWLPDAPVPAATDVFFPFSIGSRNCVGMNFAKIEMRLGLASFLRHFDIAPIPAEMEQAKDVRHFITLTVANNKFNCMVTPRQH